MFVLRTREELFSFGTDQGEKTEKTKAIKFTAKKAYELLKKFGNVFTFYSTCVFTLFTHKHELDSARAECFANL